MADFPEMRDVTPSGATEIVVIDDQVDDLVNLFTITEEMDRARHIDTALRTLHNVMTDTNARSSDKVSAAKLMLEACGKLGRGVTNNTFVRAENAQINQNEITDNDAQKLKDALGGMAKLLQAEDAGIRTHRGGQGA